MNTLDYIMKRMCAVLIIILYPMYNKKRRYVGFTKRIIRLQNSIRLYIQVQNDYIVLQNDITFSFKG